MFLLFGAFIAGILTVLAPCVLPLLPIIIGGSVSGNTHDKRRPLIIAISLAISLIVFTLLLKATTLLINIPPAAITYFSGGIIIALGFATLFPQLYATAMARIGFEHRAQKLLGKGTRNRNQLIGPIITGAALGPVFSSCSPVYAYILATVLPAHFATAFAYIISYVLGLALVMLAIGYYGQRFSSKLKFASKPDGWFQRSLAILFIVVGALIFTGTGTKIQTYVANHSIFNLDKFSSHLLPKNDKITNDSSLYNVNPYPAPELAGLQNWINSSPQTLAGLKGKVVLVDFWTYSCINCIRSLPYVTGWYNTYQKDGFVVLGIHAPEFAFEKVPANVEKAVKDFKINYPVALDNNLATWAAFQNQYWPAEYLIDKSGNVRRAHFGEGEYDKTEQAIRGLLKEGNSSAALPTSLVAATDAPPAIDQNQTPETYLGSARADAYNGQPSLGTNRPYSFTDSLRRNEWSLSGDWNISGDKIIAAGNSKIRLNYAAKNVYLVAGSDQAGSSRSVTVSVDGKPAIKPGSDMKDNRLTIDGSRLYTILSNDSFSTGTLQLDVPNGVDLHTFTFGN